jgi:hypothetical protein
MSRAELDTALSIRPYTAADESKVLALLTLGLGGGPAGSRSSDFFRWKHLSNPFGTSMLLVAELDDEIVGLRAFMRWTFTAGDRTIRAVRAVDTVTHPAHQGKGIFSKLTRRAVEVLREDTDLIFNTPNAQSGPGYLKMGWKVVGKVPVRVRIRRPVAFARGIGSARSTDATPSRSVEIGAPAASEILRDDERLHGLVNDLAPGDDRLATPTSVAYLTWRYGESPLGYRVVVDPDGNDLRGLAVFRIRPRGTLWEATIADVLTRAGDERSIGKLLDRVCSSARIDHATCHFPDGSATLAAARRRRFVRSPTGGLLLTVNPLVPDLDATTDLGAWALSLGTLEVF